MVDVEGEGGEAAGAGFGSVADPEGSGGGGRVVDGEEELVEMVVLPGDRALDSHDALGAAAGALGAPEGVVVVAEEEGVADGGVGGGGPVVAADGADLAGAAGGAVGGPELVAVGGGHGEVELVAGHAGGEVVDGEVEAIGVEVGDDGDGEEGALLEGLDGAHVAGLVVHGCDPVMTLWLRRVGGSRSSRIGNEFFQREGENLRSFRGRRTHVAWRCRKASAHVRVT